MSVINRILRRLRQQWWVILLIGGYGLFSFGLGVTIFVVQR